MSLSAGTAYVDLTVGKTDALKQGVASAGKDSGSAGGNHFRESFMNAAKALAGPLVALFAIDKIKQFISKGIKDAGDYNQVARVTANVLTTTGGAAGITADGVSKLAGAMSSASGVSKDLIQHGANVMLTFTGVKNAVGAGNDIFNRGTQAALDMSRALGTDMQGATIQVGKALNDPIKGVTALQRVGVSFTAQQKDQISAMVKSGHTMDAQKLILNELGKEFGGTALAMSSTGARLKVTMQQVGINIGQAFLPWIGLAKTGMLDVAKHAVTLTEPLKQMSQNGANFAKEKFTELHATLMKQGGAWDQVLGVIKQVLPIFHQVSTATNPIMLIFKAIQPILPQVMDMIKQVASILLNSLMAAFKALQPAIPPIVAALTQIVQIMANGLMSIIQALLPVFPILADVIGQVAVALAGGLSAAIQAIAPLLPVFAQAIAAIALALSAALIQALQAILPLLPPLVQIFANLVADILPMLAPLLVQLANLIVSIVQAVAPLIVIVVQLIAAALVPLIDIIQVVIVIILAIVKVITSILIVAVKAVIEVFHFLRDVFSDVANFISGKWHDVVQAFQDTVAWFGRIGSSIGSAISDGFKGAINWVIDRLNWFLGVMNSVIDGLNHLPGVSIGHIPSIPHMAEGGIVRATPGGTPILVGEAGEDEAVIPLHKLQNILGGRPGSGALAGVGAGGRGSTYNIYETGDPHSTAMAVDRIQAFDFRTRS